MFSGIRNTANRERDVKALAGVKSPPSNVKIPNDITVTITGMLFSMKLLNCNKRKNNQNKYEVMKEIDHSGTYIRII